MLRQHAGQHHVKAGSLTQTDDTVMRPTPKVLPTRLPTMAMPQPRATLTDFGTEKRHEQFGQMAGGYAHTVVDEGDLHLMAVLPTLDGQHAVAAPSKACKRVVDQVDNHLIAGRAGCPWQYLAVYRPPPGAGGA